jgi:hypothetical protein
MGCLEAHIDKVLVVHSGLKLPELPQREAQNHLVLLKTNFGHSLAQAPWHHRHMQALVQQGSLGHSPGNPLRGPHLMVVPAQGADERELLVYALLIFLWLYVYVSVEQLEVVDSR